MKICLVTEELAGFYGSGGIGAAFYELALILANRYTVDILYCSINEVDDNTKNKMLSFFIEKNIKLNFLDTHLFCWGDKTYDKKSYSVYQYLKNKTYDAIHFHDYKGLAFFSTSAKKQGLSFKNTKLIIQMHGPTSWTIDVNKTLYCHEDQLIIDFMERESIAKADIVTSPSRYLIDYLKEHQNFSFPERALIIKNPCSELHKELKRFIPNVDSQLIQNIREIIFFGRHEARKGLVEFCDAIDRLHNDISSRNITVTFLGKLGNINGQPSGVFLAQRAKNWTISLNVITNFHRKESAEYLVSNSNSLVIIPSEENSPYTVLETLILNKPLITSIHGGAKELIEENAHTHSLCNTYSPSDLADQIKYWLNNGGKIPNVSQSIENIENDWIEMHDGLLNDTEHTTLEYSTYTPLVTVGITHHERPEKLVDAIISLVKQTYKNIEILVVDDGSHTQTTKEKLKKVESLLDRVGGKIYYQDNKYLGAARNTVAKYAKGKYLCFLDDDDIAKTFMIEKLVTAAENTNADIVNCLNQFMDINRRADGIINTDGFNEKISYIPLGGPLSVATKHNVLGSATAIINKSFFERIGGYTELYGIGHEDYEFFLKTVQNGGKIEVVPEALYLYEVGRPSMISKTSAISNFKRIFDAIELKSSEKEYKNFMNMSIGKHAYEHQHNRIWWMYSQDENSDILLPLFRNEFSGYQLLEKLSEYSKRIHSYDIADAFSRNAFLLTENPSHEKSHKGFSINHKKTKPIKFSGETPIIIDTKINLYLNRNNDALENIVKILEIEKYISNEIITSLNLITEKKCVILNKESVQKTILEIEKSNYNENENEKITDIIYKLIAKTKDSDLILENYNVILAQDEEDYLTSYPDIKKAIADGLISNGLNHYLNHGVKENRKGFYNTINFTKLVKNSLSIDIDVHSEENTLMPLLISIKE